MSSSLKRIACSFIAVLIACTAVPSSAGILSLLEDGISIVGKGALRGSEIVGNDGLRGGEAAGSAAVRGTSSPAAFAYRAAAISGMGVAAAYGSVYVERVGDEILTYLASVIPGEEGRLGPILKVSGSDWRTELVAVAKGSGTDTVSVKNIVVDLNTARTLDFTTIERDVSVYVRDSPHTMHQLRHIETVGPVLQLKPGLVLPLSDAPLSEQILSYLDINIDKARLHFVTSMTRNDADSFRRLANVSGDKLKSIEELKDPSGRLTLPKGEGNLIVFIGHVEDDGFAIRLPDGTLAGKIRFETINAIARANKSSVVFFGCGTFLCSGVSGTINEIRDTEIADALRRIEKANSNADLLATLGSVDAPFVITESAVSEAAQQVELRLKLAANGGGTVRGGAISIRVLGFWLEESVFSLASIVGGYGFFWMLFYIFDHSDDRSLRKSFETVFPTLPNPLIRPRLSFFLAAIREAAFYVLAPLVVGVFLCLVIFSAFNFSFSSWSRRDDLFKGLWGMLILPHLLLLGLCIWMSNVLIVGFPALCVLALAITILRPSALSEFLICLSMFGAIAVLVYRKRANILRWSDDLELRAALRLTKGMPRLLNSAFVVAKISPLLLALLAISVTK
jgi:hypothetical protein